MAAEILHCPACGAAASSEATRCDFCGAALATVACPSCFGMMFAGAKFCSHCGAKGARTEVVGGDTRLCPRCRVGMKTVTIGDTTLLECATCEGIWVDPDSLQAICAEREKQAAVLGVPAPADQSIAFEEHIQYIPCPVCYQLMNRVNFAHCSHVIVDVCKAHGTWFDKNELRRAVEFIRAGGMEKARTQQLEQIKEEQRRLAAARSLPLDPGMLSVRTGDSFASGSSTAIDLLFDLLR
jgi:Zn-finger nucleic acid-binding protein